MKEEQTFSDIFSVGYDNKNGKIPVLVVGRNTKFGIDVINVFKSTEAEELYQKLITPITLSTETMRRKV